MNYQKGSKVNVGYQLVPYIPKFKENFMNNNILTDIEGEKTFEIINYLPSSYRIWHIAKHHMPVGYIPLCKLKAKQPFEGCTEIEPDTLKAISLEDAVRILSKAEAEGKKIERKSLLGEVKEYFKKLTKNIFDELYYLKRDILIAENIVGYHNVSKAIQYKTIAGYTAEQTTTHIIATREKVKALIPSDMYEKCQYVDSEVYTDKYYHRKFFNEIENDIIIENILNNIIYVLKLDKTEDKKLCLSLYDLNNEMIFFCTEKDMEQFTNNYSISLYTAYSVNNNSFVELYSV